MKRWMKYVRPHLRSFILGPCGMILEAIGEMFMPLILGMIINDGYAGTLTVGKSIGYAGILIVIVLLMMTGGVAGAYFGSKASVNFAADLRRDVYTKIQKYSFSNIDKFSASSLVTRMTNDVTQLQNFVNMLLRMALRSPSMFIGGIIMAITLRPSLSVVLGVTMPLMLLVIFMLIRLGMPRFAVLQKKVDKLNATVRENVTNVRVVKSFVREDYEIRKFETDNAELKNSGIHAVKVMIYMMPVMNLFMYATIIAIIWMGHKEILYTGMPVGDLSAFITYATQILSSLMMVSFLLMTSSRAMASAK